MCKYPFENEDVIQKRRHEADRKRKQNDFKIVIILIFIVALIITVIYFSLKNNGNESVPVSASVAESSSFSTDSSFSQSTSFSTEQTNEQPASEHKTEVIDGRTYIDGILIVNKTYSLPSNYDPGLSQETLTAFETMQSDAANDGINLYICSGYRSYADQQYQYNIHVENKGKEYADRVSARPGYSEHQSGLCMDVNTTEDSFAGTAEAIWINDNCAKYGFIIRFPKEKEEQTGYKYEPWHIRYVGIKAAQEISEAGLCLEEYLGVKSEYQD